MLSFFISPTSKPRSGSIGIWMVSFWEQQRRRTLLSRRNKGAANARYRSDQRHAVLRHRQVARLPRDHLGGRQAGRCYGAVGDDAVAHFWPHLQRMHDRQSDGTLLMAKFWLHLHCDNTTRSGAATRVIVPPVSPVVSRIADLKTHDITHLMRD